MENNNKNISLHSNFFPSHDSLHACSVLRTFHIGFQCQKKKFPSSELLRQPQKSPPSDNIKKKNFEHNTLHNHQKIMKTFQDLLGSHGFYSQKTRFFLIEESVNNNPVCEDHVNKNPCVMRMTNRLAVMRLLWATVSKEKERVEGEKGCQDGRGGESRQGLARGKVTVRSSFREFFWEAAEEVTSKYLKDPSFEYLIII